jgi:hypothetical protein
MESWKGNIELWNGMEERIYGNEELRNRGFMEEWIYGIKEKWKCGIVDI